MENSSTNIILSICIPTYNRGCYLEQSLDILLPQLKSYTENTEVIISDNCSNDNTEVVVEKAVKKYDFPIVYSKNQENIGGNNNMAKVVSNSSGKYVFLMGDDDILSPDIIDALMKRLRMDKEIGLLFFNRLCGDSNCDNCSICEPHYSSIERVCKPADFIKEIMDKANFISSVVFNRVCWNLGEKHLDEFRYFGYQWYARLFWGAIEFEKPCVYYFMPLVIQRDGEKTWLKYWPQYYLGSMSNIFHDLDEKVPGVYNKWSKKLRIVAGPTIKAMVPFKDYYKQENVKNNIQQHLTRLEIIKMNCYLNLPLIGLWFRLCNKVIRVFNR